LLQRGGKKLQKKSLKGNNQEQEGLPKKERDANEEFHK